MNSVELIGRIATDPEVRTISEGNTVAKFRLAVDRRGKNKTTDFITIQCWNKDVEFVTKYLEKGRLVSIEGSLLVDSWKTPEGQSRESVYVNADSVQGLDYKKPAPEEELVAA